MVRPLTIKINGRTSHFREDLFVSLPARALPIESGHTCLASCLPYHLLHHTAHYSHGATRMPGCPHPAATMRSTKYTRRARSSTTNLAIFSLKYTINISGKICTTKNRAPPHARQDKVHQQLSTGTAVLCTYWVICQR